MHEQALGESTPRNASPGRDSDRTATPGLQNNADLEKHEETRSVAGLMSKKAATKDREKQDRSNIYELDEDDPARPANWTKRKKLATTLVCPDRANKRELELKANPTNASQLLALTTLSSTFVSSSYTAAETQIGREYGVGREVTILGVSLFVAGYIVGPIFFAPVSSSLLTGPSATDLIRNTAQ